MRHGRASHRERAARARRRRLTHFRFREARFPRIRVGETLAGYDATVVHVAVARDWVPLTLLESFSGLESR
jgi:hypothetical protein